MARGRFEAGIASVTLSVLGAAWFVFSLLQVVGDAVYPGSGWMHSFHAVGISLPWAALLAAMLVDEDYPLASRRLAVVCLFVSTVLAVGAAIHHLWLDPVLGVALVSFHGPSIWKAVLGLRLHEVLLTVHGPLLAVAVWYWLRSNERLPAPLAGTHVVMKFLMLGDDRSTRRG